ncbi:hypothetical protein XaplCFBP3123_00895 [Xanthomonas arboricola pv. populi]|nr:hypothetical protein XaplCFBP3123_00895 [Xanthomonas arboricola pv. populi]
MASAAIGALPPRWTMQRDDDDLGQVVQAGRLMSHGSDDQDDAAFDGAWQWATGQPAGARPRPCLQGRVLAMLRLNTANLPRCPDACAALHVRDLACVAG